MPLSGLTDEAWTLFGRVSAYARDLAVPTVRLGVTGLSRAGKTVFISALVHNLTRGGRLPLFEPVASHRITRAYLQPQPDDLVPRFAYEEHVGDLVERRDWPVPTSQISELRVTIEYESASFFGRTIGQGKLHLDIVDYPGEWLLDLPLLVKDYATWSAEAVALARTPSRQDIARPFLALLADTSSDGPEDEAAARRLADAFKVYLRASRQEPYAFSTLPPGRFLEPGDLKDTPALTFAPLDLAGGTGAPAGGRSLRDLMERRYEAYKEKVVRPFYRNHFVRLDRQVVLVDALQALNAGPAAVADLSLALTEILQSFRPGRASWLASILSRPIDRILFCATKADHLHRTSHDRLEAVLRRLVDKAIQRAEFAGASVDVVALAAVRATREVTLEHDGETLPAIVGVPLKTDRPTPDGQCFDGKAEFAVFPGDLPADPAELFAPDAEALPDALRFVRFRPPRLERSAAGLQLSLPHIRLDSALQFLLGDKLA